MPHNWTDLMAAASFVFGAAMILIAITEAMYRTRAHSRKERDSFDYNEQAYLPARRSPRGLLPSSRTDGMPWQD